MRRHNQFRKSLPFKSVQGSSGKSGLFGVAADAGGTTVPRARGRMAKNKDFETSTGKGGETHQHVPKKGPHSKPDAHLTTNQGIRVSDNQNSLRAGARAGWAHRWSSRA